MDYIEQFKILRLHECQSPYPRNDIGIARLFYDLHNTFIRYVIEPKTWYVYTGKIWKKDEGGFCVMEMCKAFTQAFSKYAEMMEDIAEDSKAFMKFAGGLTGRKRREGILSDARSIQPMSLSDFDRNKALLNCQNGTYSLTEMALLPHNQADYITKMTKVEYIPDIVCERWESFINEVMCGDKETSRFLQKALGYALSGDTSLECFFIFYGNSTRNGKSTLTETISNILADYARTIQPQTLARRSNDGSSPSPDIARLKGARLVNTPEPEKGLELNTALIKQLTGGDTYTGRFLHENPIEYKPEFKIFINTNHLPKASDQTIFSSGRVKLIPFERHFKPEEQDTKLKWQFRKSINKSGILNWLVNGYKFLQEEGLKMPERITAAIEQYQQDGDIFGTFFNEVLIPADDNRLKTSILHKRYTAWAKLNGYKPVSSQEFVGELRRRFWVKSDYIKGNVVMNYDMKK